MITASLVSHGHGTMVNQLIQQLAACPEVSQIILTRNIPDSTPLVAHKKLVVIDNQVPAGFGANHNAAFLYARTPYFCVINPDITLGGNPFPGLLSGLNEHNASLAAPLVISPDGKVEDSIRLFPTPFSLVSKAVTGSEGRYSVKPVDAPLFPEWIAGMFMLFNSATFKQLGGFDERFFLYYEDVDICVRAWAAGLKIVACPSVYVIHAAQRASHRNWRFLRWHFASMARYFYKHLGKLPLVEKNAA